MSLDLDSRFSFDSFIVGASSRLAAAAAKRVAESPGSTYNPLFIYSASGLGKTHLIMAIGQHIRRVHPNINVMYDTLEHLMDGVMSAIQAGERDAFRNQLRDVSVLLLDDVQFLAGRRGAQEELLRAMDSISARGGQIVLASDRPPASIDELDQRLLSRFSGGLITDLDVPDYETRVAIVTRKASERGQQLSTGVAETVAKIGYVNVRELQGALNRVLAVQELDGRAVSAQEAAEILGVQLDEKSEMVRRADDEFNSFMSEISTTVDEVVAQLSPEQLMADAILRWEGEGYRTARLEAALSQARTPHAVDHVVEQYEQDVQRLQDIASAIRALDPASSELARMDVLRNPDRVAEAEEALAQVRERMAPLPPPPDSPDFATLTLAPELLAVRAARAVATEPGERYNPFFVHGPDGTGKTAVLAAVAREIVRTRPDLPLAFITGAAFSAELIAAISQNRVDSWRARYRRARVLVIDDVDALVDTERAQEELFHLFDAVRRAGGQLVFAATTPPRDLRGIEDRLRSRLESGLVIDLTPVQQEVPEQAVSETEGEAEPPQTAATDTLLSTWFLTPEKVLWKWPYLEESLILELD
ncbi:MAG TPA: DnaA/Hda family protein [Longimicrobiales bacterium]